MNLFLSLSYRKSLEKMGTFFDRNSLSSLEIIVIILDRIFEISFSKDEWLYAGKETKSMSSWLFKLFELEGFGIGLLIRVYAFDGRSYPRVGTERGELVSLW